MIYHIYANRSNIGDWLSAKGIQSLLAPLPITECFCDQPFVEDTMQSLSAAKETDLIIIGGGGLFMDYFIPFWEAFRPVADRVPFCIWGVGYCDLKSEDSLPPGDLLKEIIGKSKLCIVRDELTRSYLRECNLPQPVACPALNIIDAVSVTNDDILHVDNYTTVGEDAYEAMCLAGENFAKQNNSVYRQTNNRIADGNEKEMEEILSRYRNAGYVLSSALHGCIIAVAMERKVLAVSGDRKIEGFMEAVGLGEWVIDQKDTGKITLMLSKLYLQRPSDDFAGIRRQNEAVATAIKNIIDQASLHQGGGGSF